MKKVGILGGTFDPVHIAHLILAEQAMDQCELDEVWFMPVNTPPHKKHAGMVSGSHRAEMTRLAIDNHPNFHLLSIELERQGRSYTVETMDVLIEMYPNFSFSFIIGGDMAKSLESWHDIDRLKQMITFIVTDRPNYTLEQANDVEEGFIYFTVPQLSISSSEIRERVREKKSIRYLTPESVRSFIEENQLYDE